MSRKAVEKHVAAQSQFHEKVLLCFVHWFFVKLVETWRCENRQSVTKMIDPELILCCSRRTHHPREKSIHIQLLSHQTAVKLNERYKEKKRIWFPRGWYCVYILHWGRFGTLKPKWLNYFFVKTISSIFQEGNLVKDQYPVTLQCK